MGASKRRRTAKHTTFVADLVAESPDGLLALDPNGIITAANPSAARMFGRSLESLVGQHQGALFLQDFTHDLTALAEAPPGMPSAKTTVVEVGALRADGSGFQAEIAGAVRKTKGQGGLILSVRSLEHRQAWDTEIRRATSLLSATLESTADGLAVFDINGTLTGMNQRFLDMWQVPRELMSPGREPEAIALAVEQSADPEAFLTRIIEIQKHPEAITDDIVLLMDGRTIERHSRPQRVDGQVVGRVWSFRDITPRRKAEEAAEAAMAKLAAHAHELRSLAYQDPLTGLANRAVFNETLNQLFSQGEQENVDVLLLDLDNFKDVNDLFGHQSGDELLRKIAVQLSSTLPDAEVVARLGGDEFVVLLTGCADVDAVAIRVLASMIPLSIRGNAINPQASIGIASGRSETADAQELLREADIAMYAAKRAGRNRYRRFQPTMMEQLIQQTRQETRLRKAVAGQEFTIAYQPIVSPLTGTVTQCEALARWVDDGLHIPPLDFIPLAESTGVIEQLGMDLMRQSLQGLSMWLAADAGVSLAVNVSGAQLHNQDFADNVLRLVKDCSVNPAQLVLEVTESVFFEATCNPIQQLIRLRESGVRVVLDDFGTGYSSLGRLQDLPVDALKIDRSFVSMIITGDEHLPILTSMIHMAHNLGLSVTAEGVETQAQLRYLNALGCEALQGYLFSRPQPALELDPAIAEAARTLTALS